MKTKEFYRNDLTGTVVEVQQTGKSFKTKTTFQATKRSSEETIEKRHYAWSGVELWLKKLSVSKI
jgi:hypothetical protein